MVTASTNATPRPTPPAVYISTSPTVLNRQSVLTSHSAYSTNSAYSANASEYYDPQPWTYPQSHLQLQQRSPIDVPVAVRNLLLSMRELQEAIRLWSTDEVSEDHVSDAYMKIGQDLNATIQAFSVYQIDLRCVH